MKSLLRDLSLRTAVITTLCATLTTSPGLVYGAAARGESGVQLLQAYLPVGTTAVSANCDQLARAVASATHARRPAASAILNAALTRGGKLDTAHPQAALPCACVTKVVRASIGAAPEKASGLLEVATSLYPACAESLEAMAKNLDGKGAADGKDGPDAAHTPPADDQNTQAWDPTVRNDNNLDPDASLIDPVGLGIGFGPGFPGSPGFTGSPPSGSIALPPVQPVVTSVANN